MTRAARAAQRQLVTDREAILRRRERYEHHDGKGRDEGDRAVAALRREEQQTTRERDARDLEAIDRALARIEDGTWGRCVDCGEAIASKRLQLNPEYETCLRCQERREFTDARLRGPDRRPPSPADEDVC